MLLEAEKRSSGNRHDILPGVNAYGEDVPFTNREPCSDLRNVRIVLCRVHDSPRLCSGAPLAPFTAMILPLTGGRPRSARTPIICLTHPRKGPCTMTLFGLEMASPIVIRTISIIVILVITLIAMRFSGAGIRRWMGVRGALPATSIFVNITRASILILGAVFVLDVLDVSITPVITALGVGGLAVALALQDTLGNLFAGLQIVASKQIRPGDYLLLDTGQEGTVTDTAWRTTTLRTQSDNLVIVPNSVLAQAIVTNYRLPAEAVATTVEFGVGYDADLQHVERVVAEVAAEVMDAAGHDVGERDPIVRFRSFGESQILCAAILYVPGYGDQFPLRSAFIKQLHERFAEEGISFPFPARTVHLVQERD